MSTLGVFIGRLQPAHIGHVHTIKNMLDTTDRCLVLLGSSLRARDIRNPLNWKFRARLAIATFQDTFPDHKLSVLDSDYEYSSDEVVAFDDAGKTVTFKPLKDYPYQNTRWQYQVQKIVSERPADRIILFGNDKDATSFYLKFFPRWERKDLPWVRIKDLVLSSTDVRDGLLSGTDMDHKATIGPSANALLAYWRASDVGQELVAEYNWIHNVFKTPYKDLPYGIIFQTADSVITWRGLVLLGQRRNHPGKNLWALPGGYVNENEWVENAQSRELVEEARTRVYMYGRSGRKSRVQFDRSWLVSQRRFDWPQRSQRGRIITTAFHWKIPDHLDVIHEAADDLQRTQFFPISQVLDDMSYDMFEDHQHIIANMVLRY